ncbi:MAG: hypothetical protein Kow00109_14190 [Acidobacteriota bacterium]
MPTYEFRCLKCDHVFTELLTVAEYEKQAKKGFRCPKCQSRKVEQHLAVQVQTSKKS